MKTKKTQSTQLKIWNQLTRRKDIIKWFVSLQLVEYSHLFQESEENSWLDRIDRRYAWVKRHLLNCEERMGRIFPAQWEMSERIAVEFCTNTRYNPQLDPSQ